MEKETAGGEAQEENAAPVDGRRLLRMHQRRLDQIRASQARLGEREWRALFKYMEQVLEQVYAHKRAMASPEVQRILRRMVTAENLEALNFELRLLAEQLGRMAGVAVQVGVRVRMDGQDALPGDRPPGGRMRLRL